MGYFKDAALGVTWVGGFRVLTRAVSFFRTILLARILMPAQFGVYAISTLVLSFLEIVSETGINVFLVQEDDDIDGYIDTAWVVSIFRGFIVGGIILLSSGFISRFFNSPQVTELLKLISLVAVVRGFINPSVAKFQKNLKFGKLFSLNSSVFIFDSIVSIIATIVLNSPIGIVWGLLSGAVLEVVLSWLLVSPRPKFVFEMVRFKKVVHRGKWVTLSGTLNYFIGQGDDAVVGKILGTADLGVYQVAYKMSTLPLTEVAQVFNKVIFPVYTKISKDKVRLRRAFSKTFTLVALLSFIFSAIIFTLSEPLIPLLLGPNWLEVVPVLKVLTIFGFVRSLSGVPFSLFLSIKKQQYVSVILLIEFLALAVLIFPMIKLFGLLGAGYATVISVFIPLPLLIYYLSKCLTVSSSLE